MTNQQVTEWLYFGNGSLEQLTTRNGSGALLERHTLSYEDAAGRYLNGNRTRDSFRLVGPDTSAPCVATDCVASYGYDARERLVSEQDGHGGTTGYTLDPAGNISHEETVTGGQTTVRTMEYAEQQLRTVTEGTEVERYFYDNEGNLDCVTASAGSQADCSVAAGASASSSLLADYSYDYLNRLSGLRTFENGVEQDVTTYSHDALDRPTEETERHGAAGPSGWHGRLAGTPALRPLAPLARCSFMPGPIASPWRAASAGASCPVERAWRDARGCRSARRGKVPRRRRFAGQGAERPHRLGCRDFGRGIRASLGERIDRRRETLFDLEKRAVRVRETEGLGAIVLGERLLPAPDWSRCGSSDRGCAA